MTESKGMTLEIPAEVVEGTRLPPSEMEKEFRKELAVALYARDVLSLGKARLLAQMTRWEFEDLLGERRIPRHYTAENLDEDLRYGLDRQ
jgi:predicted HTH domain antitoxin